MECNTLRPGLLVSLKTSLEGGVNYRKRVIETPHRIETGAQRAKWETVRTITDPFEHDRAVKVRSKIRNTISGVCALSAFGLLCPETNVEALEKAIAEAREVEREFNDTANSTKVNLYVITGRIAPDDAEAIRAINSEIADLIQTMSDGLKKLDVKVVREAANKARSIATMLSEQNAEKVTEAITKARSAARKLVKAGDAAAVELDYAIIQGLEETRTAFLDVGVKPTEVAAPDAEVRAIDVVPEIETEADTKARHEAEAEHAEYVAGQLAEETMPDLELAGPEAA